MTTANDVLNLIKDNDVKFADFRFTDPRGKWQHVTFDIGMIEEETFSEGMMFDGSSIAGCKAIHESDMCLMPDPNSACIDPFYAETTIVLVCDVLEPTTGEPYSRDPRSIARKAEAMVNSMGVGDTGLMAGLDGIKNKLDPGPAIDKDLYDLPPAELKQIPTVCGSLREALGCLDADRAFLKAGGVFDDDFIDSYIDLKMSEVIRFEHTPHPVEFEMYYSA
jgi:glutamine synthetase